MTADHPNVLVDADPPADTYRATYRYPIQPPSTTVALALTEITERGVTDLLPLHHATGLSVDALDDLFDPESNRPNDECRVTFTYCDYTITVKSRGRVLVRQPTATED